MSRNYRATGVNLRRMPLGENDLLLTILTRENGLVRAVARGARKAGSRIGGRTEQFVVNDLQLYRGRSLDHVSQAESVRTFPGLLQDLGRLTAAQYMAEGVMREATEGQAQEELFDMLLLHLDRLAAASSEQVLARLVHGLFQLLTVGGVAPEVHFCTVSHRPISGEAAGFSIEGGGLVALECFNQERVGFRLDGEQVAALQLLAATDLSEASLAWHHLWVGVERLLRRYIEFHFEKPVRSALLLESCFEVPTIATPTSHL